MKSQREPTPKAHVAGHAIPGQRPIRCKPRASPWVYVTSQLKKPQRGETTRRNAVGFAPLGLWRLCGVIFPGALPQAITFCPVGAESQGADGGLAGGRIYCSGTQSRRAVASRRAETLYIASLPRWKCGTDVSHSRFAYGRSTFNSGFRFLPPFVALLVSSADDESLSRSDQVVT